MAQRLNTATSVVDSLKAKGLPSDKAVTAKKVVPKKAAPKKKATK